VEFVLDPECVHRADIASCRPLSLYVLTNTVVNVDVDIVQDTEVATFSGWHIFSSWRAGRIRIPVLQPQSFIVWLCASKQFA